jgi:hypothetical protein
VAVPDKVVVPEAQAEVDRVVDKAAEEMAEVVAVEATKLLQDFL